ncbi:MAG: cellulase family glycosylhydrolase, partial [Saprospiraceae bacterium]|nr:cellulase family glycosylhydrolase [Saprospiraceae bacterium]
MKKVFSTSILIIPIMAMVMLTSCKKEFENEEPEVRHIVVNAQNQHYFSYTDGKPYIPVGINMINPSGKNLSSPDLAFEEIETWMKNLSENGGNYIRIWLSQSFWDIEEKAGVYNEDKAKRIDRFIELARKYQLHIKITFEHFRSITTEENPQPWATKFAYHTSNGGPLDSIGQYLSTAQGKSLFLNKIDFYKNRYGEDQIFFGLELWNEMNAMVGPEDETFFHWNEDMLAAVKTRFPSLLVMQSLGSFDTDKVRPVYQRMMTLPGNEVAQVHRYLDLGAPLEVCHGPMDIIASSAVEEILSYNLSKPVILAETGAVEPRHAGPSKYYERDTAGILLHDILFAPFFSGSAGAGMSWHWESYVHKNNLWYHFGRFNEAIKNINPL